MTIRQQQTLLGRLLAVIDSAAGAIRVTVTGTSKTIVRAAINTAAAGDNTIIAAPATGAIHITHLTMQNTSAAPSTVILKNGAAAMNGTGYLLNASGGNYTFDAPGGPGSGDITLSNASAFVINLSAANQLNGHVLYWVG